MQGDTRATARSVVVAWARCGSGATRCSADRSRSSASACAPGGSSPDLLRAEREARIAASLNHPHIVGVYDLVDEDDQQWLVMEYVEGTTLAELVRDRGAAARRRGRAGARPGGLAPSAAAHASGDGAPRRQALATSWCARTAR